MAEQRTVYLADCRDCGWVFSADEVEYASQHCADHVHQTGHWVRQGVRVTQWSEFSGGPAHKISVR